MLIPVEDLLRTLAEYAIPITGVLHIGAHNCEEKPFYDHLGISNVVWVEAMEEKVAQAKARGIQQIYQAVITDKDNEPVTFHISNNGESSSIFEFGVHTKYHPEVHYVGSRALTTTTVDTLLTKHAIDTSKLNFWNIDIQGAEYKALKGGLDAFKHVDILYIEVNKEEMYKGCELVDKVEDLIAPFGFKKVLDVTGPHCGDVVYIRSA
jgi:FkbM family methyltransferase